MNKVKENYSKNIFINCPFDDDYFELLQPLIFTIVYFGFQPRISLESSDSGAVRLDKIIELMKISKYSIHDLSRLQAKSVDDYFRLNMPFELGLDFGLRKFSREHVDKRALILETQKYEYMKAISDINGYDIKSHNDNPEQLIKCIRSWFAETIKLTNLNASVKIYSDFIEFNKWLFLDKVTKYENEHTGTEAERFATKEIEELTIPEFINKILQFLKS